VLRHTFALASLLAALIVLPDHADAGTGPVQVFILAGQSNMVGYGKSENGRNVDYDPDLPQDFHTNWPEAIGGPGSLRYMVANDWATFGAGGTNPLVADTVTLADVLDTSNKPLDWRVRDDVNVYARMEYFDGDPPGAGITRKGGHTTGFGKGNNMSTSYPQIWNGPEYGFGLTVGNVMDQDALIIKVATGGTSLDTRWLSPTAATRRSTSVGYMWPHMVNTVNDVLANLDTEFPEYAGRTHEIAGFGWHQGWNDRVGGDDAVNGYEQNMVDFIADVRTEFGADLPFVIANTGMDMPADTSSNAWTLVNAQNAMADFTKYPQHAGNVAVVNTVPMYRDSTESPSAFSYHWNHNGVAYYDIGTGMGQAYWSLAMTGDVDFDGDIDNVDIGIATGNFTGAGGSTSMIYADGDMDGDGDVDNVDIGMITGAFTGAIVPPASSFDTPAHTIPEPATLALLALAPLAMRRRMS
jgi:hypothetical protein